MLNYQFAAAVEKPSQIDEKLFTELETEYHHTDPYFNDYSLQVLLPHKLSQTGPCLATADVNGDGYDDLYITSGINEDVLYLNQGDGTFKNIYEGSGLEITRGFVTQGVSGADVNRDGGVDLFVTTITTKDSTKKIPRANNLLFLNN